MPMNTDLRLKWAAALRSGEYTQGKWSLCRLDPDGEAQYCCLGVLAQIEDALEEENNLAKRCLKGSHNANTLTAAYLTKWGLTFAVQDKFINANDALCWTFHEIADAVEAGTILGVEI